MRPLSKDKTPMSAAAFDLQVSSWVRYLEAQEARRSASPIIVARRAISRREGVPSGTLENISRQRTKGVRAWVAERIRSAMMRELQSEISRLSHELEMVRQGGADPRSDEMVEIQTHLARVRQLLSEG